MAIAADLGSTQLAFLPANLPALALSHFWAPIACRQKQHRPTPSARLFSASVSECPDERQHILSANELMLYRGTFPCGRNAENSVVSRSSAEGGKRRQSTLLCSRAPSLSSPAVSRNCSLLNSLCLHELVLKLNSSQSLPLSKQWPGTLRNAGDLYVSEAAKAHKCS